MENLGEDKKKLFKSGCIYTSNYTKYKKYIKEYKDIIKNVYTEKDEIISFIKDNESCSTDVFHSFKLLNYDNYIDKYYLFHKIISNKYREDLLNNNDYYNYDTIFALLSDMKTHGQTEMDTIINFLASLNEEKNSQKLRENMVKAYTGDVIYKDFNAWLNEFDFLSYGKISFFIALLMYGISDINHEKKGLKESSTLYRGLKMSYINLSFYERNINKIITFPSFTSCSNLPEKAFIFSGRIYIEDYKNHYLSLEDRKKGQIFSVMITIDYKYQEGWEPSAFKIYNLSEHPHEKEIVFLPFSFFKIKNFGIDFEKYEANIELENIGKKTVLEKEIQKDKIIIYNEKENIMEENNNNNYPNNIDKILMKEYKWLYDPNLDD